MARYFTITAIAKVIEQLGTATHDIYLNDIAYWKNITHLYGLPKDEE
jgi:hypothetical protein